MTQKGMVTLVGAGPGDPGLFTMAGRDALMEAEVVLYDRLVGSGILALAPADAEMVAVGKSKGEHSIPQSEINQLLVDCANDGRRVVRLKGGDPYLFGRGAEEVEALRDHGIPFRVIPGVTSAIAVPAYAGIPVTHRDHASSVHVITGHGRDGQPPRIAYRELAGLGGTLVFLMGFSAMDEICGNLLTAGMPDTTPAAVIANGTMPSQRRLTATLADLAEKAGEEKFSAPAVVVVGDVCALTDRFDWTGYLPLWGRQFLVVSTRTTGGKLAAGLRTLGAGADELPCLRTEPLPLSEYFWQGIRDYDWVALTSPYGAELFFENLVRNNVDIRTVSHLYFAAVGRRTAEVIASRGIIADFVPDEFNAASMGRGLADMLRPDDKLLLYRARDGSEDLIETLREKNVAFDEVAAYRAIAADLDLGGVGEKLRDGLYDAVAFGSASAVNAFASGVDGDILKQIAAVCIGGSTGAAAFSQGMQPAVAGEATLDGMIEYILKRWGKRNGDDSPPEEAAKE